MPGESGHADAVAEQHALLARLRAVAGAKDAVPPAECRGCGAGLGGAEAAGSRWAQTIDAVVTRRVTERALPGRSCRCCGTVTFADAPGAHAGSVSYGPALNAAAVVLAACGNVPPERAARVIGMLLGIEVSAGWAGKAAAQISAQPRKAGCGDAMIAALAAAKRPRPTTRPSRQP